MSYTIILNSRVPAGGGVGIGGVGGSGGSGGPVGGGGSEAVGGVSGPGGAEGGSGSEGSGGAGGFGELGTKCPESYGTYRSKKNCGVFYVCAGGIPYEFTCPAGLNFHEVSNDISKNLMPLLICNESNSDDVT